ncbi:MAG: GerAB/ArcD/ProY family transporter [Puniceicoccales bacterium]|nr:GerAB/ArcD/ProY family transporter [Puniceicoccales bacterium]
MKSSKFIVAILFIAGNAIGAGVLGLPLVLSKAGFAASAMACLILYALAMGAGSMFAGLFCENHQRDLPTFFSRELGQWGSGVFLIAFLSLFFCLLVAYWAGLQSIFRLVTNSPWLLFFTALIAIFLQLLGAAFLSGTVSVLTVGLIITFFALTFLTFTHKSGNFLATGDGWVATRALPILFCSYGFQGAIPIVCRQLDFDRKRVSRAILYGTLFPLIFNILVLFISFGALSADELLRGAAEGMPVFLLFKEKFSSSLFTGLGQWFSFFAIGSSLLGVTATLSGALGDIFHRHAWYKRAEAILVIVLPMAIATCWAHIFVFALEIAGGICLNVIAGILPSLAAIKRKRVGVWPWIFLCAFLYIFAVEVCNLISVFIAGHA